ncbi:MAG: cyclic nucleotide-binding domain-containing protein [Deltaproteobacteria bacterium]|nr:cyclic nucleotide-binding domain-containing protein [Deltaproteobacteria bacterium]
METKTIIETLKKCELFNHLNEGELLSLAKMGKVEEYDIGDELFRQGDVGLKLYVLSKGHISLNRKVSVEKDRKGIVSVYEARERPYRRLLGGWSTLVGEQHVQMCTARCNSPSTVISIPTEDLRIFFERDLELRVKILEKLVLLLGDRLASSYAAMETL